MIVLTYAQETKLAKLPDEVKVVGSTQGCPILLKEGRYYRLTEGGRLKAIGSKA